MTTRPEFHTRHRQTAQIWQVEKKPSLRTSRLLFVLGKLKKGCFSALELLWTETQLTWKHQTGTGWEEAKLVGWFMYARIMKMTFLAGGGPQWIDKKILDHFDFSPTGSSPLRQHVEIRHQPSQRRTHSNWSGGFESSFKIIWCRNMYFSFGAICKNSICNDLIGQMELNVTKIWWNKWQVSLTNQGR